MFKFITIYLKPIVVTGRNLSLPKFDLIESFKNMPFGTLTQYTMNHNIYLENGGKEGILISYMDMESSDEKLNMLVDGET